MLGNAQGLVVLCGDTGAAGTVGHARSFSRGDCSLARSWEA